jgi:hypothetical protein
MFIMWNFQEMLVTCLPSKLNIATEQSVKNKKYYYTHKFCIGTGPKGLNFDPATIHTITSLGDWHILGWKG